MKKSYFLSVLLVTSLQAQSWFETWDKQFPAWKTAALLGGAAALGFIGYKYYTAEAPVELNRPLIISAASWNVLAEPFYAKYSKDSGMSWSNREPLFSRYIDYLLVQDIICFQEFDSQHILYKNLKNHFYFAFSDSNPAVIGTAIAYNKNSWTLEKGAVINLAYTKTTNNKNIDVVKKNIIARLRHLQTNAKIIVASVHLPSIPGNKEKQLEFLDTIDTKCKILKTPATLASLMMGDFNYNTYQKQLEDYEPRENSESIIDLNFTAKTNGYNNLDEKTVIQPSAFDNNYTRMDYGFIKIFSPKYYKYAILGFNFIPNQANNGYEQLLRHTAADQNNKTFPSDHSIMQVQFTLEKKKLIELPSFYKDSIEKAALSGPDS